MSRSTPEPEPGPPRLPIAALSERLREQSRATREQATAASERAVATRGLLGSRGAEESADDGPARRSYHPRLMANPGELNDVHAYLSSAIMSLADVAGQDGAVDRDTLLQVAALLT